MDTRPSSESNLDSNSTRVPSVDDSPLDARPKQGGCQRLDEPKAEVISEKEPVIGNVEGSGNEYPHGLRLLTVVLALVLSMFLVCLDMVREHTRARFLPANIMLL